MVLHEAPDPRDFIIGGALRPCPYAVAAPGTGSGSGVSFRWRRHSNGAPAWAGQPVWEQCVASASSVSDFFIDLTHRGDPMALTIEILNPAFVLSLREVVGYYCGALLP